MWAGGLVGRRCISARDQLHTGGHKESPCLSVALSGTEEAGHAM